MIDLSVEGKRKLHADMSVDGMAGLLSLGVPKKIVQVMLRMKCFDGCDEKNIEQAVFLIDAGVGHKSLYYGMASRKRDAIKERVIWPEEAKNKVDFGRPFKEIRQGFEQIETKQISESVRSFAYHEQINILQKVLYDDPYTRAALDGNQFAWVTHFPTGDYAEIQLTLSAQCSAKRGRTEWFSKSLAVHLWNADDRMEFVNRAAGSFNQMLLGHEHSEVERSINAIYLGGGVS